MSTAIYFVDLDGTLIAEDSGFETLKLFVKKNPKWFFNIRFLYLCLASPIVGRARIKRFLAQMVQLDLGHFHYNDPLIAWLKEQKASQHVSLVLTTGTDERVARQFADYFGCFDKVIASDGVINRVADDKRRAIEIYMRGRKEKSCYVGNSSADLKVWPAVDLVIGANLTPGLIKKTKAFSEKKVTEAFEQNYFSKL